MTGRGDPAADASLTYLEVLAAMEARRVAADRAVMRTMLPDSIHAAPPPADDAD
jgi:hypothetical protein